MRSLSLGGTLGLILEPYDVLQNDPIIGTDQSGLMDQSKYETPS